MQLFQAPPIPHEFAREPVQQLGMGRPFPVPSKVRWGGDKTNAEVVLPDAVYNHPCGQWIRRRGKPVREFPTAALAGCVTPLATIAPGKSGATSSPGRDNSPPFSSLISRGGTFPANNLCHRLVKSNTRFERFDRASSLPS
jgi:hypothetical protein